MYRNMTVQQGIVGFGLNKVAAEEDCYTNKCIESIDNDYTNKYKKRRNMFKPWLPMPGMLHISRVGCLVQDGKRVYDAQTKQAVYVQEGGKMLFYYIAKLLGNRLWYEDIVVTMQKEFMAFFLRIEPTFVHIRDYPTVQILREGVDFMPTTVYTLESGIVIGFDGMALGVREKDSTSYYVVELEKRADARGMLAYIAYRMGIRFDTDLKL